KQLYPQIELWRQPPYEYETVRLPIDLLTGGELFRGWVDDDQKGLKDLEDQLKNDEEIWREERLPFLLY
ncbi:MAG: hypothetical protein KDD50_15835, partial [Bdellovibrionales bacterium]|nr:hypothetical protein [Bdellovibrionales bacterium]